MNRSPLRSFPPCRIQVSGPLPRAMASLLGVILILASAILPGAGAAIAQEAAQLQITSKYYVVMNADTGDVFAQRGADTQVAIASLTKVFTAIEALELAPLDTPITTDESDLMSSDATTMGFGPGETYTLEDMLYGMLLPSGNDAAHAIARSLGYQEGDTPDQAVDRFMALVNQRVQDMGLKNTHLVRPDGWGVPGHYSSAADVAAFFKYAIGFPEFVKIIGTTSYTTSNGLITVSQSNKMINTYANLVGGKTGYDDDAGWCLVNLAQQGDLRMIAVTLDGVAPDDWYDDNTVLLNYGFEQQTALDQANTAFSGTTIGFTDPSAAQLARSARSGSDLVSAAGTPAAATSAVPTATPLDPVTDQTRTQAALPPESEPTEHHSAVDSGPVWVVVVAFGIIAVTGAITWWLRHARQHGGRDAAHVDTVDPTPENEPDK
ncbi:MAG: D-alanyl-D-alanine carboxypeptidase family protein [Thermomicrobiales bacterium]